MAVHLDGAGDEHLALAAAAQAALGRIVLAALRNFGLVDLHQAVQRRAVGRHHGAAKLGAEQPRRLVRTEPQLFLHLQGGDAVGVGGHQVGGPEPGDERHLRAVHHRAGGHRGLLAATGAFPGEGLRRQSPSLITIAGRTPEAVRPAGIRQIRRTGALVGEAALELQQRSRKVEHDGCSRVFALCSTPSRPACHHISRARSERDKPSTSQKSSK